jgi:ankyrin repeat protein
LTQNGPLHHDFEKGHRVIRKVMIIAGDRMHDTAVVEETPCHLAAELGPFEVSTQSAVLDFKTADNSDYMPLHRAVSQYRGDLRQLLTSVGVNMTATKENNLLRDDTTLHFADRIDKRKDCKMLISTDSSIEYKNQWSSNPLNVAVLHGREETCRILLGAGADANIVDGSGEAPLHEAIRCGRSEIFSLLLGFPGTDLEVKNNKGYTPLLIAAEEGDVEVCRYLLSAGADLNAMDRAGYTPLHRAASEGHEEVCALLISAGTDVNARGSSRFRGHTALHHATYGVHMQICQMLVAAGAQLNLPNGLLQTPLHDAAYRGLEEICELLINAGADVNTVDEDGYTPLHFGVFSCRIAICSLLVEAGADIKAKDKWGNTPLERAHSPRRSEIYDYLKKVQEEKEEIDRSFKRVRVEHYNHTDDNEEGDGNNDNQEQVEEEEEESEVQGNEADDTE